MPRIAPKLIFAVACALLPRPVAAQPLGALTLGVVESHVTLGANLGIPLGEPTGPLMLGIGGAVEAPDDVGDLSSWTYWEGNVDLLLRTTNENRLRGFALTGLNLAREARECPFGGCPVGGREWDTSLGVNVGAGFALVWESFAPFLGAKVELRDGTPWAFFLGTAVPFPGYE